jgi:hypothetical protein
MVDEEPAPMKTSTGIGGLCLAVVIALAGNVSADSAAPKPLQKTIAVGSRSLKLTLSKPATDAAPPFLVVFASGDGGLRGASKDVMRHLIARGFWVAAFSSPEAFKGMNDDGKEKANYAGARDRLASIIAQAKQALGVADQTSIVIAGMSRGANVVVAAAGDPSLKPGIVGAVAIALTREFDELTIPDSAMANAGVTKDDRGRLQTYPGLERLGSLRLAVIQSTNDSYVRSSESRRLLGPDTSTRRLYEVESKNHSFGGGEEALMRSLDDAMTWIEGARGVTADAAPRGRMPHAAQRSEGN